MVQLVFLCYVLLIKQNECICADVLCKNHLNQFCHVFQFGTSEMLEGNGNLVDKETLSVITDATKSLARRVKSNLMSGAGGSGTVSFNKFQSHPEKSDDSDTSPVNHDPTGIQKVEMIVEL